MHIINISKREFKRLNPFQLSRSIIHSEADLYEMDYCGERKIVKTIFTYDKDYYQEKIRTIATLDEYSSYLPRSFTIPDNFIAVRNKIKAFTTPFLNGETLDFILNNPTIPIEEHIYYLTKIGTILEELKKIRKTTPLKELYIGDLHESNIIINRFTKELNIIDLDSSRIGSSFSYTAKYLTPFSLLKHQDKYILNKVIGNGPGFIVPDQNTDIYCYIVMILNYITDDLFKYFNIEDFYTYLNMLNDIGINQELLYIIEKIFTKEDNINPYEYLITLSTKDITNTRESAKKLIKQKKDE